MTASGRTVRLRLLELRQAKGLTQEEVASALGTTRVRVGNLEAGITRRVELDTLAAIARLFDVTLGELFTEAPAPLPASREARQTQAARPVGRPRTRARRRS